MAQLLWKTFQLFFYKTIYTQPRGPPIQNIHSREMKIHVHTQTCTPTFIAVLFIRSQTGNNPEVLQWVNI
jgi:hypothetical protein